MMAGKRESKMKGEKKDDRCGRQWASEAERNRERERRGEKRDKRCKLEERAVEERKSEGGV